MIMYGNATDKNPYYWESSLTDRVRWYINPVEDDIHFLVGHLNDDPTQNNPIIYHVSLNKCLETYNRLAAQTKTGRLMYIWDWIPYMMVMGIERSLLWTEIADEYLERYANILADNYVQGVMSEEGANQLAGHLESRQHELFVTIDKVS